LAKFPQLASLRLSVPVSNAVDHAAGQNVTQDAESCAQQTAESSLCSVNIFIFSAALIG
jgi:hypothetical protein